MSIGPVVTRGYGSGGSIALIVTRGYSVQVRQQVLVSRFTTEISLVQSLIGKNNTISNLDGVNNNVDDLVGPGNR